MRDWLRRWLEIEERPSPPIHVRADLARESVVQPALDHADRFWKAEEENSRRLSVRVNLLLTGFVASFGVGIVRLGSASATPSSYDILFLFLGGLGLILLATLTLVGVGRPRTLDDGLSLQLQQQDPRISSFYLPYTRETLEFLARTTPPQGSAEYYRLAAFQATLDAASDLMLRNRLVLYRIDRAERWFGAGILFLILSILLGYPKL